MLNNYIWKKVQTPIATFNHELVDKLYITQIRFGSIEIKVLIKH